MMQVDDLLGAIWLPGDGKVNPTDLTQSLAQGRAAGRRPDRRAGAGHSASRPTSRPAAGHRRRAPTAGTVEAEVVVNCARPVGQGARRPGRRDGAAALGRALLRRHRGGRGRPPRPADHARPGRLDLLQGGGRRPGRRRLRARGQAVALARRPAAPLRVPAARRGLGALLGADGRGAAPDPGAGGDRDPQVLQRSRVVHPRQPVPAGRGARARRLLRRRRLQLRRASPPPGGAGRALAEWIVAGEADRPTWSASTYAGSRRFHGNNRWLRDRVAEVLGLHYAVPWPNRELETARPFRRSPLHDRLAARGASFGSKMGWERPNVFAPAGRRPSSTTPGASRPGCRGRRPSSAPPGGGRGLRPDVVLQVRRRRAGRARGACSGSAPPTSTCRSGAASTRRCSTSAAPTRPTSPSPGPVRGVPAGRQLGDHGPRPGLAPAAPAGRR